MKYTIIALLFIALLCGCSNYKGQNQSQIHLTDSAVLNLYMSGKYDSIVRDSQAMDNTLKRAVYSVALTLTGNIKKAGSVLPEIEKFKFKSFYSEAFHKPAIDIETNPPFSSCSGWAMYKYGFNIKDTLYTVSLLLDELYEIDSTNPLVFVEAIKFNGPSKISMKENLDAIKKLEMRYPYWLELYEIEECYLVDVKIAEYKKAISTARFLSKKNYNRLFQEKFIEIVSLIEKDPNNPTISKSLTHLVSNQTLPLSMRAN